MWAYTLMVSCCLFLVTQGQPRATATLDTLDSSSHCGSGFLVAGLDHTVLQIDMSSKDPKYTFSERGPQLVFSASCSNDTICNLIQANGSCMASTESNTCSCQDMGGGVKRLTYNFTAATNFSKAEVFVYWLPTVGQRKSPTLEFHISDLPQVKEICPTLELIKAEPTWLCAEDYLVAKGGDFTRLEYLVSQNSTEYAYTGLMAPRLIQTRGDEPPIELCAAFDLKTGACDNTSSLYSLTTCRCEKLRTDTYRIRHNIVASHETSEQSVYMMWPGDPDILSEKFVLPKVRDHSLSCPGLLKIDNLSYALSYIRLAFVTVLVVVLGARWMWKTDDTKLAKHHKP